MRSRDQWGQTRLIVAGTTFGNGLAFVSDHDLDGRPINRMVSSGGVAPTYVQRLTYGYDADNRMTSITDGVTPSQSQTYGYDELSRLKSLSGGSGITGNLSYDPNGNRLGLGAWSFGYESGSNQITLADVYTPISVQTDGRGNVKQYDSDLGSWGFNYDGFNRLQSRYFVTFGRTNSATGTYTYNVKNERVTKVSAYEGTFRYTYAEDQTLLAERNDGTGQWTNYLWFAGEPVGIVRGTTKTYLHADHAGRPQVGTNASKQIVWKMQDDVFGNRYITTDNIGGLNLGYPGQYFDAEAYLWYNVNRTYDPMTGRYLQVDPIGLGGGINPYVYGGNNPVGNADPLGLYCLSNQAIGAISGAAGGAFSGGVSLAPEFGPFGAAIGVVVGGVIGGGLGYVTTPSQGMALGIGAANGAASGLNSPVSNAIGGVTGAAIALELQSHGASGSVAGVAGGTGGGFAGGAVSGFLTGQSLRSGAVGGLTGLSGAAISAAVAAGLQTGNNCPCSK